MIKSLSLEFKDRLAIGECRHTEKAAVKVLGVTQFPTLMVFPAGEEAAAVVYDGPLKPVELKKFLSEYALLEKNGGSSSSKSKPKTEAVKPKPVAPCKHICSVYPTGLSQPH